MTGPVPRRRLDSADAAALLLLTAIVAALFADLLFAGAMLLGRDLVPYHYGMKKVVRELMLHGDFPYWNRLFSGGQPLAANPAYEVFYPLQLLILLPSFNLGFNLHLVAHVLLAAAGMYLLLRQILCGRAASFFGAVSFALSGMVMSFTGLLPFLFSTAWMPWVALFAVRWFAAGRRRDLVLGSFALSMQAIIGEPLTMAQTCALLAFGAIWFGWERGGKHDAVRCLAAVAVGVALALAIAAVQLVPAVDFVRDTVRSRPLGFRPVSTWSLPLLRPIELFLPKWAGPTADDGAAYFGGRALYGPVGVPFIYSIYLGLLISTAALAGMIRRVRGWSPVLVVVGVSYLFAIGSHTPLLKILYDAHLFDSIRYPEKFFIGAVFVIAIFGSFVLDRILEGGDRALLRVAIAIASIIAGMAATIFAATLLPGYDALFASIWHLNPTPLVHVFATIARHDWLTSAVRAAALAGVLAYSRRLDRRAASGLLLAFVLVDLVPVSQSSVGARSREYLDPPPLLMEISAPSETRVFNQAALERFALRKRGLLRIEQYWIARNGLYPFLSAYYGLSTVMESDIDATSLLNVELFDELAQAALIGRYPVWPDLYMRMGNARLRVMPLDERQELARAPSLDVARVVRIEPGPRSDRYSFASQLVHIGSPAELDVIGRRGGVAEGTAFVPLPSQMPAAGHVIRASESANGAVVEVSADGQAFLVASVTGHRYWSATIDGAPAAITPANVCFQGLFVPPGRHTIVFRYRNPMIRNGAIVSLLAIVLAVLMVVTDRDAKTAHSVAS